jgi:osmotically-inducible protein OsmY
MITLTKPQTQRSPQYLESDNEVQRRVLEELRWDSDIDEATIEVGVDRGVVTLTGTVRSWPEREAVFESVSHALGVHTVINSMKVNPLD